MENVIHGLHIQLCLCMTFTVLAKLSVQEKPISSVILFLYSPIIVMSSALKEGKKKQNNKRTRRLSNEIGWKANALCLWL